MPRHLLTARRLDCVLRMRGIVDEGRAKLDLSPMQRVLYVLEKTRLYCQETTRADSRKRSMARQRLHQHEHKMTSRRLQAVPAASTQRLRQRAITR